MMSNIVPFHEAAPYALVADADARRIDDCVTTLAALKIEHIVARDGDEALGVLDRRGVPSLLLVDLSLPRNNAGFVIIEAATSGNAGSTIAWAARRELREYAVYRLRSSTARVLGGCVASSVLRSVIAAALPQPQAPNPLIDGPHERSSRDIYETMAVLSARAQRLCGTAGAAVYLRAPDEAQFRTALTWSSETPMPQSPDFLPSVFDAVLATGDSFFRADVAAEPLSNVTTGRVRGLGAVPLIDPHGQVVGAMCVFDVNRVAFGHPMVAALKSLGRRVSVA